MTIPVPAHASPIRDLRTEKALVPMNPSTRSSITRLTAITGGTALAETALAASAGDLP